MASNSEFPGPILGGQFPIPRSAGGTPRGAGRARPTTEGRLKPTKRRRTRGQRILRVFIIFLLVIVVLAASGYGYFRYEWGQIKTAVCPTCVAVANGAPYNVLVIGSDTRTGETAAQAQQFGSATTAGGQRSDTIKIVHVDPQAGTASTLSIPRDTFVTLSGVPASSGVSTKNKINAAFAAGPNDPNPSGTGANGVVQTVENTFGIPISHWIVVNFFGLTDAVNGLGGIKMNFPYPVKDYGDCNANGVYSNCTGLNIPTAGCQVINGTQALALSRSRHFEYYQGGTWVSDYSSDIGRITRQNLVIEGVVNRAKSTYNPIQAASFISSLTHDVTLDSTFGSGMLLSLAEQYHAFSGSSLQNYTIPTVGASYAPYGGEAVQVVQEPQTQQIITQFLGGASGTASTPPLDAYGSPVTVPTVTATTAPPSTTATTASSSSPPATAATSSVPSYDPTPC
ncbi:MAG TPA: LCP family protein [Acidimicrobiales bacterium]|nr:LCP family protein [Acidimicrobiales bacterium]